MSCRVTYCVSQQAIVPHNYSNWESAWNKRESAAWRLELESEIAVCRRSCWQMVWNQCFTTSSPRLCTCDRYTKVGTSAHVFVGPWTVDHSDESFGKRWYAAHVTTSISMVDKPQILSQTRSISAVLLGELYASAATVLERRRRAGLRASSRRVCEGLRWEAYPIFGCVSRLKELAASAAWRRCRRQWQCWPEWRQWARSQWVEPGGHENRGEEASKADASCSAAMADQSQPDCVYRVEKNALCLDMLINMWIYMFEMTSSWVLETYWLPAKTVKSM